MEKGLKDLKWWAVHHGELREPSGAFDRIVILKARPSLFGCPHKISTNGRESVCGARLMELEGLVLCGSYNVRRWMVCPVCEKKVDREAGLVRLPELESDE